MQTELEQLLRRVQDLVRRAEQTGSMTSTGFLSPAEQAAVAQACAGRREARLLLFGGDAECERRAAFFLPDWMEPDAFEPEEHLRALRIDASFGTPEHRDYLGALLGLGVKRPWVGDIRLDGQTAWVFCLPSVAQQLSELRQAGRVSVRARLVPLSEVPLPERKRRELSFTVQSLRFDAVLGELFRLSRTSAAKLIAAGAASLNYLPCLKNDAPVKEGDVLSLRGHGKGAVLSVGGQSRKGRLFIKAELY